jgi:acyl-coenzyme A thioesterase PaaI-like protein
VTADQQDDITAEELDRQSELNGRFGQALRELVDASIRTAVAADDMRRAMLEIEQITVRLRERQLPGSFGSKVSPQGERLHWGNAAVGLRNAIAPPLLVERDPSGNGNVRAGFQLGAAYEGPPGLVHGGICALILDQMLGEAASAGGKPGMTGRLTITYHQPTPLGKLRAEAWIDRSEGIKTWARGHIIGSRGVTVEAEGVFILPSWAREAWAG